MASSQTCGGMQRHRPAESNARKGLAGSPPEATSGHAAGSHGTVTRRRGSPSSQHPRRSPSARSPQWYLTATGGAPRSGVRSTATSCAEIAEVRGSESQLAGPPAWCAGSKGDAGRGQLELRAIASPGAPASAPKPLLAPRRLCSAPCESGSGQYHSRLAAGQLASPAGQRMSGWRQNCDALSSTCSGESAPGRSRSATLSPLSSEELKRSTSLRPRTAQPERVGPAAARFPP
mmetsp:Transcript_42134/g.138649  ORF Transcript_42134/g.138649 Transcript_42134/m.138649 type:complete len:233 (-) Transcript_42134:633-1331(-)